MFYVNQISVRLTNKFLVITFRVAEMEKKIELTNKLKQELPVKKIKKEESDDEDDDYEEFLDWRTKK